MRLSDFWVLVRDEFGSGYAAVLTEGQHLTVLGGRTAVEALEDGVPPREVWAALCDQLDVPQEHRRGRDRPRR